MKNKGFTLIELLSVIVILGILAGISLPSISKLIRSQEKKQYQTHLTIVKAATDAYVDQFGEAFKEEASNGNACSCYKIPYWAMIDEKLINEENVTCDLNRDSETKGFVIAKKLGDSLTNYSYSYYLECKDLKKNKLIHETMDIPTGCCGVNGNFMITELTVKYNNAAGAPYNGEWTNQNIYQHIEANNPYLAGIKGFEYSLDGGKTWNYVKGKDLTLTAEMNVSVQVRAIDNENNKSSVKTYTAKIDKTAPSGNFDLSGTMGNNGWYKSDVTIRTKDVTDGAGSGIATTVLSHTSLYSDTAGTEVRVTITDKVGNVYTDKTTIKLDKTNPTCVSSGGQVGWTNTNLTAVGTCSDNLSGCSGNISKTFTTDQTGWQSPGLVYDNAGNSTNCGGVQVHIDKTPPTCTTSGGTNGFTVNNVTITGNCRDNLSGCKGNASKSYTTDTDAMVSPGIVYDNASNSVGCPQTAVQIRKVITKYYHCTKKETSNDEWYQGGYLGGANRVQGRCTERPAPRDTAHCFCGDGREMACGGCCSYAYSYNCDGYSHSCSIYLQGTGCYNTTCTIYHNPTITYENCTWNTTSCDTSDLNICKAATCRADSPSDGCIAS